MQKKNYFIENEWNDFYDGSVSPNFEKSKKNSRVPLSSTDAYIYECSFCGITSTSTGGAVYSTETSNLLIESTNFYSCKTSADFGGAIHFTNTNTGQFSLNKVCAVDCYTTFSSYPWGQFLYVKIKNDISYKNTYNCSSVYKCVNTISTSCYTMVIFSGKILLEGVNETENRCYYTSGFYTCSAVSGSTITFSLLFSSFVNNKAIGCICIRLETASEKEFKSCNIVKNTREGSITDEGTIYTCGNLNIKGSCILENTADYVFYATSGYVITLSDCTTDALNKKYGSLTVQNTADYSFINALVHIETGKCESSFDSFGSLTVRPIKGKRKTIDTHNIRKRDSIPYIIQYLTLVLQS